MTENFETDAHDYLLNQMEAGRRSAFEQELQRSPEARAALKAYTDSFAGFARDVAGLEPLSASDHQAVLSAIVAATQAPHQRVVARKTSRIMWQRFFWPAAALLLLALNLIEFERPLAPSAGREPAIATDKKAAPTEVADDRGAERAKKVAEPTAGQTPAPGSLEPGPTPTQNDTLRELGRVRDELAELQRSHETLRANYNALIERVANIGVIDKPLDRLTTMELVDAASYARGERKGLVGIGRGILTEPGIVVVTEPSPPTVSTAAAAPKQPYAWSVFDEKEHRGYLNLYNLPAPPGDQSMQVWVRPADGKDFQRVGEVPQQFHGGGGALQYTLPSSTTVPAEIMVTIEPRNVTPAAPMGSIVLKGP